MLSYIHKSIHVFLALVILLIPMQFAFAQEMNQIPAPDASASTLSSLADEINMQHQQMNHSMTSSMDMACDNETTCTDCAYCSPALTHSSLIVPGKLPSAPQLLAATSRTSIDPTVESRPPKQL